jgi:hypothetical protein
MRPFEHPKRYPAGIPSVMVNGVPPRDPSSPWLLRGSGSRKAHGPGLGVRVGETLAWDSVFSIVRATSCHHRLRSSAMVRASLLLGSPCGSRCWGGRFWNLYFHAERESPRLPRSNCPHPDHALTQHFPAGIIDLNEHRVLPRPFGAGIPDDALKAERTDGRGGLRRGDRVESKAALTCGTAYRAPENQLTAVRTAPRLSLTPHGRSPFERLATCHERSVRRLPLFPPEGNIPAHL